MALSSEQVEKVRLLMASSGWNDVIKPVIAKRAHDALKALILSPAERSGEYQDTSDDIIRARIKEDEFLLTVWTNEIVAHDQNRMLDEIERQQNGANPQNLAANP
jgi:hypothetical protein